MPTTIQVSLTATEAVAMLRLVLREHYELCQEPTPANQVECAVLESISNKLWTITGSDDT